MTRLISGKKNGMDHERKNKKSATHCRWLGSAVDPLSSVFTRGPDALFDASFEANKFDWRSQA